MDDDIRIGAAATALGVSIDTLRRWERRGRVRFERRGTQRYMTSDELARLMRERASDDTVAATPNRLPGIVLNIRRQRSLTEVELACGPFRVVSVLSPGDPRAVSLRPGDSVVAVMEATSVALERA
jgi:MerR HTH family regulatory protein/TOBE domain